MKLSNGILEDIWTGGAGGVEKSWTPILYLNIPAFPEEEEGDWSESLFGTIEKYQEKLEISKRGHIDYDKGYEPFKSRISPKKMIGRIYFRNKAPNKN